MESKNEHSTPWTLRQKDYNSRGLHTVRVYSTSVSQEQSETTLRAGVLKTGQMKIGKMLSDLLQYTSCQIFSQLPVSINQAGQAPLTPSI